MPIRDSIILDLSRWKRSVKEVKRDSRRMGNEMGKSAEGGANKSTSAFGKMGRSAKMWIGGVAVTAVYALVRAFKAVATEELKFNQNMNESLAIMGKVTMEQRTRMEQTAREVSSSLNISSDKVAKAYYYLASAGLSVEQQISSLSAVAEFSKAGMFDLASATEMAVGAQAALGLKSEDAQKNLKNLTRVTDVLSKANVLSQASIEQFSQALTNDAGSTLKVYGKSIEEGTAVLAAYAAQNIKGAEAGTMLGRSMRLLSTAAIDHKKQLNDLGIAIYDENGKMRNMADIIGDMEKAFRGMSDEQRSASLTSIGFAALTQKAILPLIGTSDAIRKYQKALESAGGTTKKIANNQLKSLTERFLILKQKIVNIVGPSILNVLSSMVDGIDQVASALNLINGDPIDSLISDLEKFNISPKLVIELKKQKALNDAISLKKKIADEFKNLKVPVSVYKKGAMDKFATTMIAAGNSTGPGDLFAGITKALHDNYAISKEAFDPKRLDDYKKGIVDLKSALKSITEEEIKVEKTNPDKAAQLANKAHTYSEAITQLQAVVAKTEELASVNKRIVDLQKKNTEEKKKGGEETSKATQAAVDYVRMIQKASIPSQGAFKTQPVQNGIISSQMNDAAKAAQNYTNTLTRLHNQLKTGEKTQAQYEKAVSSATDQYQTSLNGIYDSLKGKLTPEQEKAFKLYLDNIHKADDKTQDFGVNLRDVADTIDGVINLADAFGNVSDSLKNTLRGSADVMRNMQKIRSLGGHGFLGLGGTGLAGAIPALGMAGGLLTAAKGVFGGIFGGGQKKMSQKELLDLKLSIDSNIRALEQNTKALLQKNVVGAQITDKQKGTINDLLNQLMGLAGLDLRGSDRKNQLSTVKELLPKLQDALKAAGIDLGFDLSKQFEDMMKNGTANPLWNLLFGTSNHNGDLNGGITATINNVLSNIGEYGNSLNGAIYKYKQSIQYGAASTKEAMQTFINDAKNLGVTIPDEILNQLSHLDLSTQGGQDALNKIIEKLFKGRKDYKGALSTEDYQSLLDFLGGLTQSVGDVTTQADKMAAAIKHFTDNIQYGGQSINEAFHGFVSDFLAQFSGPATSDTATSGPGGRHAMQLAQDNAQLSKLLEMLQNYDLTTKEGQQQLSDLIKNLYDNKATLQGSLSNSDYQSLLDFLNGLKGSAGSESPVTKNVGVSSSITEYQANQLIMIEEASLLVQRQQLAALQDGLTGAKSIAGAAFPANGNSVAGTGTAGNTINLGGIAIAGSLTDSDIAAIMDQISKELKKIQHTSA